MFSLSFLISSWQKEDRMQGNKAQPTLAFLGRIFAGYKPDKKDKKDRNPPLIYVLVQKKSGLYCQPSFAKTKLDS